MYVCVCVCVWERDRDRERDRGCNDIDDRLEKRTHENALDPTNKDKNIIKFLFSQIFSLVQ